MSGECDRLRAALELIRDGSRRDLYGSRRDLYGSTYIAAQALRDEPLDPRGEPCAKCGGNGPCGC